MVGEIGFAVVVFWAILDSGDFSDCVVDVHGDASFVVIIAVVGT